MRRTVSSTRSFQPVIAGAERRAEPLQAPRATNSKSPLEARFRRRYMRSPRRPAPRQPRHNRDTRSSSVRPRRKRERPRRLPGRDKGSRAPVRIAHRPRPADCTNRAQLGRVSRVRAPPAASQAPPGATASRRRLPLPADVREPLDELEQIRVQ